MLRPYVHNEADRAQLDAWYAAHGYSPLRPGELPATGFVVEGAAAGFLYRTDSDTVILEGFITNPDAPPEVRYQALEQVHAALVAAAQQSGARRILALTADDSLKQRALTHGFTSLGLFELLEHNLDPETP
jgi:hypothetical protein